MTAPSGLGLLTAPPHIEDTPESIDPDLIPDQVERGLAWAEQLSRDLNHRAPIIWLTRDYFHGRHPIRFATDAWRDTFGDEFGPLVDNWCRIVIEAATERMTVNGFLFGGTDADDEAWDIWQRNRLDLDADVAHTDALTTGYSYALVWPGADGSPEITVEDPLHAIVELDPANRRRRLAGMKRWRRRDGTWEAFVFTPDRWWHLEASGSVNAGAWTLVAHAAHRLGVVPLIPLTNTPDVYGRGYSDLAPILPLQDAINKLGSDEMIASEFAAYRQRVLLGVEVPLDPETNEPRADLVGGINRWMAIESEDAKIHELAAADLSNYHGSIEQKVQHISALTRTPPHYLLGRVVNVSADALRAAESGLVSRVKRRSKLFGESWEEALRLAFRIKADGRADAPRAATVWSDPETMSEGARVDALTKMRTLGVPDVILWERWGMSPQEIDRALKLREQQAIAEGLTLGSTPNGAPIEPPAPPTGSVEPPNPEAPTLDEP